MWQEQFLQPESTVDFDNKKPNAEQQISYLSGETLSKDVDQMDLAVIRKTVPWNC